MKHAIEILLLKWNEYHKELIQIPLKEKSYYSQALSDDDKKIIELEAKMESCLDAIVALKRMDPKIVLQ